MGQTVGLKLMTRHDEVADRRKISIPAACYRAKQIHGPCYGCVVDVDGELQYACNTVPEDVMIVVVNREDLKSERMQRLRTSKSTNERNSGTYEAP